MSPSLQRRRCETHRCGAGRLREVQPVVRAPAPSRLASQEVATEQALATLVGDEQISRYWVVRSYSNTNGGLVKVRIDPEICQGQGRCFSIAPSIFDFDDLGNGVVIGDGTLNADTIALAQLAQANCPEHAIFIEE